MDKTEWLSINRYLKNECFKLKEYTPRSESWEHEHCEFCGSKFSTSDGDLHHGYASTSRKDYWWICPECFKDFKEMFGWTVKED